MPSSEGWVRHCLLLCGDSLFGRCMEVLFFMRDFGGLEWLACFRGGNSPCSQPIDRMLGALACGVGVSVLFVMAYGIDM